LRTVIEHDGHFNTARSIGSAVCLVFIRIDYRLVAAVLH